MPTHSCRVFSCAFWLSWFDSPVTSDDWAHPHPLSSHSHSSITICWDAAKLCRPKAHFLLPLPQPPARLPLPAGNPSLFLHCLSLSSRAKNAGTCRSLPSMSKYSRSLLNVYWGKSKTPQALFTHWKASQLLPSRIAASWGPLELGNKVRMLFPVGRPILYTKQHSS